MRPAPYLVLAFVLLACQQVERRQSPAGQLEVSWTGKDRGGLSGAATARWCATARVLEIQSIAGDTGVALALYTRRSLVPGAYPVIEPAKAESLPPAAGVAVRWLGQSVVQGFQGDSGRVVLERSRDGLLSGRVTARARSVVDTQRIRLSGSFRDLPLRPDSLGCPAREDQTGQNPDPEDTSVH